MEKPLQGANHDGKISRAGWALAFVLIALCGIVAVATLATLDRAGRDRLERVEFTPG